jgi:hypothetical protein
MWQFEPTSCNDVLRSFQSYAVFLAYYLNSGAFPEATPLILAFVGGLSFSVGKWLLNNQEAIGQFIY